MGIKITHRWDGSWGIWRDGYMVGALTKYTNNQWSIRGVEPAPFDIDTPIRTHHIQWAPTFREAKAAAKAVFA